MASPLVEECNLPRDHPCISGRLQSKVKVFKVLAVFWRPASLGYNFHDVRVRYDMELARLIVDMHQMVAFLSNDSTSARLNLWYTTAASVEEAYSARDGQQASLSGFIIPAKLTGPVL
jgi:hypothetical protein